MGEMLRETERAKAKENQKGTGANQHKQKLQSDTSADTATALAQKHGVSNQHTAPLAKLPKDQTAINTRAGRHRIERHPRGTGTRAGEGGNQAIHTPFIQTEKRHRDGKAKAAET